MSNQIKGKIYHIGAQEDVTEKFSKRAIILETDDQYAPFVKLEFTQERCGLVDSFAVGSEVTVTYDVKGSKSTYTNKSGQTDCFVALQAWKITGANDAPKSQSGKPMTPVNDLPQTTPADEDSLPF
jgi:single-strand DNA-binding protein